MKVGIGDDPRRDGLGHAVTAVVADSGGYPGEELLDGTLAVGLGFIQALAGDLDVEILRPGEPESGGQINRIGRGVGWLSKDGTEAQGQNDSRANRKAQPGDRAP